MERAVRLSDKPEHLRRASQLWLHADKPEKALTPLKQLAARPDPEGAWLASLYSMHRVLDDILAAVAAMEIAGPENKPDNCTEPNSMSRSRWVKGRENVGGERRKGRDRGDGGEW